MYQYNLVFVTSRSERHQQAALAAAPDCLKTTLLYNPERSTLKAALTEADYLISERSGEIDADLIQAAPRLQLIQRLGSLIYDIDVVAAQQNNIEVCYWPIDSVINVSEHLVLQMLALGKQVIRARDQGISSVNQYRQSQQETTADIFVYNWSNLTGLQGISNKTVGILGFGQIGIELARRLAFWNCNVLYNKRCQLPPSVEADLKITYADWDTLFSNSDYLCSILPYSETGAMVGKQEFNKMKQGSSFVSCGAGSMIDFAALAASIQSGHLVGAAVDSYAVEPPSSQHPLIMLAEKHYNVLLTPHIAAGDTRDPVEKRRGDYDNILNHIGNRPRRYVVRSEFKE